MPKRTPPEAFLPDNIDYLTSVDVAKILGVVPERIRQLRRAGQLVPVHVTRSGIALYASDDIEAVARARKTARGRSAA